MADNDIKIVITKLEALEKHIDKRFEQVDKRFEQVDKRFEQVDKRFDKVDRDSIETRNMIVNGLSENRSMINTGLKENRNEINETRRFSFALFCFALTFSAISLASLLGKMFGFF
jgi:lipopolysaccharide export LptBFGC system permease protein LptF